MEHGEIPESKCHNGQTDRKDSGYNGKQVDFYPPRPEGFQEARPHYEKYLEEDTTLWCDYYECSTCESRCTNRRAQPDLWELCFLCQDGVLDIKDGREGFGLTIQDLAKLSRVSGKNIKELESFPGSTIPPQPRLDTQGNVVNGQERTQAFSIVHKIARAFLRLYSPPSGKDDGFSTPKIICDCCGWMSAPVRTGETAYPICQFCHQTYQRIAKTDPLDQETFFKDFPKDPASKTLRILGRAEVIIDRSSFDGVCVFCEFPCKPSNTKGRVCDPCEDYLKPLSVAEFKKRLQEAKNWSPFSDGKKIQILYPKRGQVGVPTKTKGLPKCSVCERPSFVWSGPKGKHVSFKPASDAIGFTCGICIGNGEFTPVDIRLKEKKEKKQEAKEGSKKKGKKRKPTKKFGKRALKRSEPLREHLKAFQITQAEFAKEVGMTQGFVGKLVRGEKTIPDEILEHIRDI